MTFIITTHVRERVLIPRLRTKLIFAETTMRHLSLQSLFAKELRLRELFPAQVPCIFFPFPFLSFYLFLIRLFISLC